jgi:hypothetical protein
VIFTNHRGGELRVPVELYRERLARLLKFVELNAPPVMVKHAAQLVVASFRWDWRGLAGDLWTWASWSRPGWWARWLMSARFRAETDAAGLEMMDALSGAPHQKWKHNDDDGAVAMDDPAVVPVTPRNLRRRFAEPWAKWRARAGKP